MKGIDHKGKGVIPPRRFMQIDMKLSKKLIRKMIKGFKDKIKEYEFVEPMYQLSIRTKSGGMWPVTASFDIKRITDLYSMYVRMWPMFHARGDMLITTVYRVTGNMIMSEWKQVK